MILNGLIKEFRIFFRNKTVLTTIIFILFIEIAVIIRSSSAVRMSEVSAVFYFKFFQQHLMIMFFPAVLANILMAAFSVTSEKQSSMLAKLLPKGECFMMRSKVFFCSILSAFMGISYMLTAVWASGLGIFPDHRFVIFLSASFLFMISGLSSFTVYFAFSRFGGSNDYEPKVRVMMIYMFIVSFIIMVFYFFISVSLKTYFDYVTGFRIDYPNVEFLLFLSSNFLFLIIARIMLNGGEKKLSEGLI
ncbi:MAG: hypothetical protein PHF33_06795 [Candidatus Delongbacteria bacterium]|nr:hypothetical protein [Candidatus Delongbacteria bacterium]MDD4204790.1 hypothetical protein [Candidatus Delongbacteria bacterium]